MHWLEVVGEPTHDADGTLTGAQGLVWNVDERYRKLDERARLLDLEHYARMRAEYIARVHDVLARSVDVDEILQHVTRAAVPDLADWCNAVFVTDRPRDSPLIVSAHRDPSMQSWAKEVLTRFPYDPDGRFGAARVIREGRRELIEHASTTVPPANDEQRDILLHAAVDSVLTVPIRAQLGLIGSLQLIRGRQRTAFTAADIELAEELASRCGAALNSAVLLARQRTSSEALETLQRVSGWLARAVTRHDVASATVTHGAGGLRADGGCVYLFGDDGVLAPMPSVWLGPADRDGWMQSLAELAVADERLIVETSTSGPIRTVLATPLRILDQVPGAVLFVFDSRREFAQEELAMALTLASRCAGALERASFYERERTSVLLLQRRLLPQVPHIPDWLEVGYCYEPAAGGQVGGDWFQLINLDDERVVAVVGDAVGHGMEAAAAMGQLKSSIATAVSMDPDPAEVLRAVDRFADAGIETLAATAVATMLDRCGTYRLASAGHLPPVLLHPGGANEVLEGGRRPLLGYGGGRSSVAEQRRLIVGDMMVLYSDGLVERRHEVLDVGIDRLRGHLVDLQHRPPQEVCEQLIDRLGGDGRTDDDIALLLLRFLGDRGERGNRSSGGTSMMTTTETTRCVLIAVDDSDESVDTARAALRLMGPEARYVLLNVGDDSLSWATDPTMWGMVPPAMVLLSPEAGESVRQAGEQLPNPVDRAEATAEAVAASAGLGGARTVGMAGHDKGDAICSVAHEEGADLIVIGQRHRGWLDRLFTRSVTNDVLRNANCPVLVVP